LASLAGRLKRVRHLALLQTAVAALTFDAGVTHLAGAAFGRRRAPNSVHKNPVNVGTICFANCFGCLFCDTHIAVPWGVAARFRAVGKTSANTIASLILAVAGCALRSGGADEGRCALRLALIDNVRLNTLYTLDTEL
jgi:hypothetical protein